ncbi:chromatin assembly factor 1 subunit FAS1 isoform X2 [Vigna radiata var. radiata]|uniref:Chromatin assembly factor 1 subunit FAS1 isoform X2 n=1 Tax=Vigna radiata var. radiata TaxID=3916 RepID=A0A3Q0EL11_VIGRR|nr:chromatin assembly factor 1 subunit FAS1 isoform X2 [Vigna radiata var. radiata]
MATPTGTMAGGAELFSTPPRPSSQDLSQDPNSNRAKTTTPRSTTPRGRKKLPFVLQNLKSAEEKQAYIETLEKELDALFRYYKEAVAEKVRVELSQCGGSRNAVVAALLEESDLPLSKLVEEIHDRLNGEVGSGAIILAEPVTYATVKSSVLFAGQRVTYGLSNADADVLEDYSESCLWCWETRDMKLLPQSIRGQLGIRRMCRKRIHDRISAVSEMIAALKRLECEPNFNDALKKASTKLSKAFPEADIRLLVDSSMQKNSEAMDKKRANQENKLLMKQLERNRRESEKEKASMHNELQRETQPNESDSQLSQGEAKNDDKCTINKQQQKKQVEETKRDQRRREKAEAELKKKRSLEKQASLMERFLKKCKTNSSPENDKVSTKSAASDLSSSKNEGLFESATLSMDCTLASSNDVTLEDIRKSHFSSWRSLGQSIRSNRKQNWGIRQMPRTEVFKELKLTTIKTDVHDDELDMEKNGDKLGGCSSDISLCPVNGDGSLPDDKKYRRARQLFQFDKSHRPAFYGVWPTKSHIVGARHPLRKDPSLDYDVSSDEEWEEEEPGESLSDCDKDEEDCQEECSKSDEESEDGFFVPDGYLSENEGAQVDGMEMEGDTKGNDSSSSYNEEFCSLLRQQKYINSLTDLALRKNQPLIITNFNHEKELSSDHSTGGISKMEQKCLQALSMYIVPGGSLVEIPEGKMQDEEQKVHRPDGKGGASSTSSVAAISDSDLLTIVTTIQSCSQGMNKVLGSLQQKLPSVPKSLMKNKVREVSEYVDNRLQVKKEVLDKLGLTEKPGEGPKSIAAFFSKRCLLPGGEIVKPSETSPLPSQKSSSAIDEERPESSNKM